MRRLAAVLLAGTGLLHLALAPEYWSETRYLGVLFVVGGIASVLLAVVLWRDDDARAWMAGAAIATGMAVGFVVSRTVGLPGFHEADWELSGLLSLLLEAGVVWLALQAVSTRREVPAPR